MRRLVCHVPDWPALSTGAPDAAVRAICAHGRVLSATPAARALGVRTGLRRREAEATAPGLICSPRDPAGEARRFEPLVRALSELTPTVELSRPGLCACAARGPARYFGGEDAVIAVVRTRLAPLVPDGGRLEVGIADTPLAARLAAADGTVVAPGGDAAFLAPFPVDVLGRSRCIETLAALGISSLGALAATDEGLVAARFGEEGAAYWRAAAGREQTPLALAHPPAELCCVAELDPPAERVDTVAFATRTMAEEFTERLARRGLRCVRVLVTLESAHGESLTRAWRAPRALGAAHLAERVRWQLEGWLADGAGPMAPTGGITLVRCVADELLARGGDQLDLFDAVRHPPRDLGALDRLSGLLGPDAVATGLLVGGRGPAERVARIAWGEERPPGRASDPWPGHHRLPAPAVVYADPPSVELRDVRGTPVTVSGRGALRHAPVVLQQAGRTAVVVDYGGPWLYEEEWWGRRARRRARLQILCADGAAHLLICEQGRWWLEASYD